MGGPIDMAKGAWVDAMLLDLLCDLEPRPWSWIFKVKFEKALSHEWDGRLTWNKIWVYSELDPLYHFDLTHDLYLVFSRSNFEKRNGKVDWHGTKWMWVDRIMERNECKLIGCWTHCVTLRYDLDFGLSRSNFEKAVSQEWDGRFTENERDVSRWKVEPTLWLRTLTSPMTLTLNFQGQILKTPNVRNGRDDMEWKGCKSIGCWTHSVTLRYPSPWTLKVEGVSKVGVTFDHVGGSFNLFKYHHWGCLNPMFSNLGLHVACWVRFMCHH